MESKGSAATVAERTGPSTEQTVSRLDWQSLRSVAAAAALLLGLIYAVGALTRSAELSNAGVPVRVAFPLIPIEQELTRGVAVLVGRWELLVLILVSTFTGFVLFAYEQKHRGTTVTSDEAPESTTNGAGKVSAPVSWIRNAKHIAGIFLLTAIFVGIVVGLPILAFSVFVGLTATIIAWWAGSKVLARPFRFDRIPACPSLRLRSR